MKATKTQIAKKAAMAELDSMGKVQWADVYIMDVLKKHGCPKNTYKKMARSLSGYYAATYYLM